MGSRGYPVIGLFWSGFRQFAQNSGVLGPLVEAGMPAKRASRCMAPASPVFAGMPARTGMCVNNWISVRAGPPWPGSAA
ncbi:hypothetical protein DBL03_10515 [Pseudomonas putida]|nr:hypothetical protein DBL03_10515 [Pseudomonas putida]